MPSVRSTFTQAAGIRLERQGFAPRDNRQYQERAGHIVERPVEDAANAMENILQLSDSCGELRFDHEIDLDGRSTMVTQSVYRMLRHPVTRQLWTLLD